MLFKVESCYNVPYIICCQLFWHADIINNKLAINGMIDDLGTFTITKPTNIYL